MFTPLIKLTEFELFLKNMWPQPYPPSSMKQFCAWYDHVIENISGFTNDEKKKLKHIAPDVWVNLNLAYLPSESHKE